MLHVSSGLLQWYQTKIYILIENLVDVLEKTFGVKVKLQNESCNANEWLPDCFRVNKVGYGRLKYIKKTCRQCILNISGKKEYLHYTVS